VNILDFEAVEKDPEEGRKLNGEATSPINVVTPSNEKDRV